MLRLVDVSVVTCVSLLGATVESCMHGRDEHDFLHSFCPAINPYIHSRHLPTRNLAPNPLDTTRRPHHFPAFGQNIKP